MYSNVFFFICALGKITRRRDTFMASATLSTIDDVVSVVFSLIDWSRLSCFDQDFSSTLPDGSHIALLQYVQGPAIFAHLVGFCE